MSLSYPLPIWGWALALAVLGLVAWLAYARAAIPMARPRRLALSSLRFATLALLLVFLLGPFAVVPAGTGRHGTVAVLVDASRSMRIADAGGERRIDRAVELVRRVVPALAGDFDVEVLAFGDQVVPAHLDTLTAAANASDLARAIEQARERYTGRPLSGLVILSDGGDTSGRDPAATIQPGGPPVFAIGIGAPRLDRDREVVALTAGDALLPDSSVDLDVTAVSHGYGTAPIELHLLANGRELDVRRETPAADGSPVHVRFAVSPNASAPTVYTVEFPAEPGEAIGENNRRSVLVAPPGRTRRILFVEGAPGFEHSFLKRAWALDTGLEVDSVVYKGKNDQGRDTFYVQAAPARTAALATGYPTTPQALFAYDAVVFANVEWDFLTRDQLRITADFVSRRGGGVLVLGLRSFAGRGLAGTELEEALPADLGGRHDSAAAPAASEAATKATVNKLLLTRDGEEQAIMRLAATPEENRRKWAALPALAATAEVGEPRPAAAVLAVTRGPAGGLRPLVVVQPYGRGRSMMFGGEASWRWKMMMPSTDRSHELFWRQAIRWLSAAAFDPVRITGTTEVQPGSTARVTVGVSDAQYRPIGDASVTLRATSPDGRTRQVVATLADAADGRYTASFPVEEPGVYKLSADARRGNALLGSCERPILAGAFDPELADPRLNDAVLGRLARASGGQYVTPERAGEISGLLARTHAAAGLPGRRDLWNSPWTFVLVVGLLASEWTLRRKWGLR